MVKSLFLAVLALCSFVLACCEPVKFKDCGSQMSALKEIDVTPCPNQPCQLKTGSNTTIEVTFIPNEAITKATTVVYGIIGGEKLPFPGIPTDACKDQGLTCPMKPGIQYVFKVVLPVKPIYPKLSNFDRHIAKIWCEITCLTYPVTSSDAKVIFELIDMIGRPRIKLFFSRGTKTRRERVAKIQPSDHIEKWFSQLKLVVQWELKDQNDKMVYCFDLPVQIV